MRVRPILFLIFCLLGLTAGCSDATGPMDPASQVTIVRPQSSEVTAYLGYPSVLVVTVLAPIGVDPQIEAEVLGGSGNLRVYPIDRNRGDSDMNCGSSCSRVRWDLVYALELRDEGKEQVRFSVKNQRENLILYITGLVYGGKG